MVTIVGNDGAEFVVQPPFTVYTDDPPDPEPQPIGPDPIAVAGAGSFDIILNGNAGGTNQRLWRAPYSRLLTSDAVWLDGDRDGYRAAYMFLTHPDHGIVGRVSFFGYAGTPDAATTVVFDERMNEAEAWYDGSDYTGPPVRELNDAPRPDSFGTPQAEVFRGKIRYFEKDTGRVLEVRSYVDPLELGANVQFFLLQHITTPFKDQGVVTPEHDVFARAVIGSRLQGKEAVNVYYDTLNEAIGLQVTFDQSPL